MFSSFTRNKSLLHLQQSSVDVLVIGGGITGAGIALDAISRGLSVGLLEQNDFAFGTSSRSTKLVHGGLRYLANDEYEIVSEVGLERAINFENAPHVTSPVWMMMPIYEGGIPMDSIQSDLTLYDYLAGVDIKEQKFMLDKAETMARESVLKTSGLLGSGNYVEYATDDSRLTLEVIKKASQYGAHIASYTKVTDFIYENGLVVGVVAQDVLSGESFKIFAKTIVNATGIWVDTLREKDHSLAGSTILAAKGVHIVLDQDRFPLTNAIYFRNESDSRFIFVIPTHDHKVYVGTTDTEYHDALETPGVDIDDVEYLLGALNQSFDIKALTLADVVSSWSGLRPLIFETGKTTDEISRKDEMFLSKSGLISMAGGKLTGYRLMAKKVVDEIMHRFHDRDFVACQTEHLRLSGGEFPNSESYHSFCKMFVEELVAKGVSKEDALRLCTTYGQNANQVMIYYVNHEPITGLSRFDSAALRYGIDFEMVLHPLDYIERRSSALFFDLKKAESLLDPVTAYMADYYGWTADLSESYKNDVLSQIDRVSTFYREGL